MKDFLVEAFVKSETQPIQAWPELCSVHEPCRVTQAVLCDLGLVVGYSVRLRPKRMTQAMECDLGHVIRHGQCSVTSALL